MIDFPTWQSNQNPGLIFTRVGTRTLSANNLNELAKLRAAVVAEACEIAGRALSETEVRNGIAKDDPRTNAERFATDRRHKGELNPPAPELSKEQQRLAAAKASAENERRSKLTRAEAELEDAQVAADAADRKEKDDVARAAIRETPTYRLIRDRLDSLLFASAFDPSVSAEQAQELNHQSALLERFLDVPTITTNVSAMQKVIAGKIETEAANLKAATDTIAKRHALMSAGLAFDSVTTETIGDSEYVVLQSGDKVAKITRERFEARESDSALKVEIFAEPTA